MSRPAPISSTTASAISETTRIPRVRTMRPPTTDRAPPCLTASIKSTFEAWSAGTRPNNRLVASDTTKVKARTPPSMPLSVPRTTVSRTQRHQRARAPEGEQASGSACDKREQQALGDQLPDDPAAPGAERRANSNLARAGRRLPQEQRGGVGTGDQQHHAHDTPQEVQRQTHVAHELVLQTHGRHATPFVAVRVLLLEARGNRGQLGLCLFERHVRFESRHGKEIVSGAAGLAGRLGNPNIGLGGEVEACRHHADDRMHAGTDTNRPLQDVGRAAEAALPVRMTNHRRALLVVGHGFLRCERAADQRLDREHTEELRIHGGQPPVLRGGTWRDRRFPAAVGGHRLERRALVAPIPIVGDRHLTLGAPRDEKRRAERHNSICARDRAEASAARRSRR